MIDKEKPSLSLPRSRSLPRAYPWKSARRIKKPRKRIDSRGRFLECITRIEEAAGDGRGRGFCTHRGRRGVFARK
ncbi:hypothetical protein PUN28_006615 [Cardiocondyla obscurior]|uniref:Uncharacterized protein n=1 Tax=Cardiocondyla obscurior TaxID=286306 RepID=A0AAW2G9H7_9HYME